MLNLQKKPRRFKIPNLIKIHSHFMSQKPNTIMNAVQLQLEIVAMLHQLTLRYQSIFRHQNMRNSKKMILFHPIRKISRIIYFM